MSRPCGVGRSGLFVRCRRGAGSSAQATKSQERQVDALLAAWNRPGMPGAVVEVIRDGKVVLAKGYGSVDLERMMSLKAARPDEVVTLEDGLALLKRQRALNFTPGQQFLYSNSGYLLLGQIVQRVSGLPLDEFARVHIFQPLGMKHTQFLQFNRVNLSPAKTR